MKNNLSILSDIFLYIFIIVMIYFSLFAHLTDIPLILWDESRVAANAYDIFKNDNWIIPHYLGDPDMWNTKPPFLLWIQAGFMHVLGPDILSIRLPSALASLFTCITIYYFIIKQYKDKWLAIICVLILITTKGYIGIHAARTGDYDALLTFFTTVYILLFFLYFQTQNRKYLYLFFIIISLAYLTKSIQSLLFIPGIIIFLIYKKDLSNLILNKDVFVGAFIFLLITGSYYGIREFYNPGYLQKVWNNELGGRFFNSLEGHNQSFYFYIKNFFASLNGEVRLAYWNILFIFSLILSFFIKKENKTQSLAVFLSIIITNYLILISLSSTKLWWYDVPIYPLIALLVGIFINIIYKSLKNNRILSEYYNLNLKIIAIVFLIFLFYKPYKEIFFKSLNPEILRTKDYYKISYLLNDTIKDKVKLNNAFVFFKDKPKQHFVFYIQKLKDKDINIEVINKDNLSSGKKIIVQDDKSKKFLKDNYNISLIRNFDNSKYDDVSIYKII